MATYTVYLPPAGGPAHIEAEKARFVADSSALLALVFPALWLLFQRLWFGLAVYLLIVAAFSILGRVTDNPALALLSLLPGLYLFLEGRQLVGRRLERLGWRFAGIVEGADQEEAELRWFDANRSSATPPPLRTPATVTPREAQLPAIGIFGQ